MVVLKQGVLIAFEGIDGSGKTTQINKVADALRKDYLVTVTHEPNHESPYYSYIKNMVKKQRDSVPAEKELEWYLKDRQWDLENNILPALIENHIVLVDRYYMSNAAYQGALFEFTPEYILKQNSFARKPDLWLILDVPVSLGQKRIENRDKYEELFEDHLEIAEYQERVRENYRKLAKMDLGGEIEWIDASINEEKLTKVILSRIYFFLSKLIVNDEY